jgi:hypothetical protein
MLVPEQVDPLRSQSDALCHLIRYRAGSGDIEMLRQWLGDTYRSHVLRCLWIDQLNRNRQTVSANDLMWMEDFPSGTNIHLFYENCADWVEVLLRSGHRKAAEAFASKLSEIYPGDQNIGVIVQDVQLFKQGFWGRRRYAGWRLLHRTRVLLKGVKNWWRS